MSPNQSNRIHEIEVGMDQFHQRLNEIDSSLIEIQDRSESQISEMEQSLITKMSGLESILKQFCATNRINSSTPTSTIHESPPISGSLNSSTQVVEELIESRKVNSDTHQPDDEMFYRNSPTTRQMVPSLPYYDQHDTSIRKIKMHVFEGNNAFEWLARIEHFFRVGNYAQDEKLRLVSLSIDGLVLSWFNWRMSRSPFLGWTDFKNDLLHHFCENTSLGRRLFGLRQTGSLASFITEFHELSTQTPHLTDLDLEHIFINGLKPALQDLVLMLNPQGLTAVIDTAIRLEPSTLCKVIEGVGKEIVLHRSEAPLPNRTHQNSTWRTRPIAENTNQNVSTGNAAMLGQHPPIVSRSVNMKGRLRLSDEEYAEKRKNGICLTCNDKYYLGHKCPNHYFQVLTMIDGCEVELVEDPIEGEVTPFLKSLECLNLSLHAFLGLASLTTTKMRGQTGKSEVIVMVDSGVTHNFISLRLVDRIKLKSILMSGCAVLLGNGFSVPSKGVCSNVTFTVGSLNFKADFCILDLGGADLILGIQWLQTLGDCHVNWDRHSMTFTYNGQRVTLLGDLSFHGQTTSLRTLAHHSISYASGKTGNHAVWHGHDKKMVLPVAVTRLLSTYEGIFDTKVTLPPKRGCEHTITLLPGTTPISVRPYRYPHARKEEMQRQIQGLLDADLIRRSRSPFASPVLLVPKRILHGDFVWIFEL